MHSSVDRPTTDRPTTDRAGQSSTENAPRRIDVTDLRAAAVDEYVRDRVQTDRVSLEHRGARTYLLVEG